MARVAWRQATAIALFAVLLLPVSYRAGATLPHAHALIQLIAEGRLGVPIHHHESDREHADRGGDATRSRADAPAIQVVAGFALLPLILISLALLTPRLPHRIGSDNKRTGRSPAPEHPPPQPSIVPDTAP